MHLILLALGLALCMAGLVLIGFGIPGNAGPGSGLIVAGMTALVGGLILVGLASAIRQLRHIGQLLEARPMPQALGPDPVGATPPTAGVATPPLTPEAKPAGPVPEVAAQTDVDRMRAAEARVSAPEAIGAKPAPGIATGHKPSPPSPLAPRPSRMTFGPVWSEDRRAQAAAERPDPAPAERQGADVGAPAAPAEVRIFKSGVIDGMAYTLYTDGSIEAELAQGTVKFASVDELRAYLAAHEP